jgi:hypothetical protein
MATIAMCGNPELSPARKHLVEAQTLVPNTQGWGRCRQLNVTPLDNVAAIMGAISILGIRTLENQRLENMCLSSPPPGGKPEWGVISSPKCNQNVTGLPRVKCPLKNLPRGKLQGETDLRLGNIYWKNYLAVIKKLPSAQILYRVCSTQLVPPSPPPCSFVRTVVSELPSS